MTHGNYTSDESDTHAPADLGGVLKHFPKTRWWGYIIFGILNLVVVIVSSLTLFSLIAEGHVEAFNNWMSWLLYVLNVIGTAFGFTAATNVNLRQR